MKKFLLIVIVLVLVAGGGVAALLVWRSKNASGVDTWIGKQIVRIASSYIEPTIDFKSILYTAPYHVEMKDATLTARDGTRVAQIALLEFELAEIPSSGQPIKIKKIVLDGAGVNLIETKEGGFKGLVPFVRGTSETRKVDEDVKLSTVLRLDKVELRNASVTYQLADGSPPMVLGGLSLDLNIAKTTAAADGVWYDLDTSFGRAPQLTAKVKGAVNLDSMVAKVAACDVAIDVSDATIQSLPPQLQSLLREHEAKGRLTAGVTGTVPMMKAMEGDVNVTVNVTDFNVAQGEYKIPIQKGDIALSLKGGVADLKTFDFRTLGGAITAGGRARLAEAGRPADLSWKLEKINIRDVLRAGAKPGEQPKFAGILDAGGTVRTALDDPKGKLAGDGSLTLKEGRLILLPGLKQLADLMSVGPKLLNSAEFTHAADAKFTLNPTGVQISESNVTTEVIAVRATGTVGFDQTMDLRANGGPIEKIQNLFGKAGKVVGLVTDKALTYRIHGPVSGPKVEVLPLGIGG